MASRDGAVEHVAQYIMTSIRPAWLVASVFVEEAGNVGEAARDPVQHCPTARPHVRPQARRRAPAIVILVLFPHGPIPPVRFGRDRRFAGAHVGNTQDTPGNGAGFEDRKGRKYRAQTPR